jgi:hypothetical protein
VPATPPAPETYRRSALSGDRRCAGQRGHHTGAVTGNGRAVSASAWRRKKPVPAEALVGKDELEEDDDMLFSATTWSKTGTDGPPVTSSTAFGTARH